MISVCGALSQRHYNLAYIGREFARRSREHARHRFLGRFGDLRS
jgi:hypothetical protein